MLASSKGMCLIKTAGILIDGGKELRGDSQDGNAALASDTAYRPPVVPVVVTGRVDIGTIKVQVVSVGTTANRTRPVVAVDAGIVQGTAIDIAGPHNPEEDSRAALAVISLGK